VLLEERLVIVDRSDVVAGLDQSGRAVGAIRRGGSSNSVFHWLVE